MRLVNTYACISYTQPSVASTSGRGAPAGGYTLTLPYGRTVDRLQLREDTVVGQRVRNYTVTVTDTNAHGSRPLMVLKGSAIGTKRILLLKVRGLLMFLFLLWRRPSV